MTSYTDWLDTYAKTLNVLVDIQPAEALTGWTATGGGHTNVYQVAWSALTQADVVPGGVYRRLDEVRQNATTLTSRASLAALDAAAEGRFYDSAASILYVKTTTGTSPNSFASMAAVFTIFVGTRAVDFVGGSLYEPRVTGDLPSMESVAESFLNGVKQNASGSVTLLNTDRFFDRISRTWAWRHKRVTIRVGGGSLVFADYQPIATMQIEDITPNDDVCTLTLVQVGSTLESFLPLRTFTLTEYPLLGQGLEGSYVPLLYGQKDDIPGLLVDSTAGAQVYLVADPQVQVLTAVTAVRAISRLDQVIISLLPGVDYTVNLAGCTVTVIHPDYAAESHDIRIDATGESDGSGGYLETCGEIAIDLLRLLGERESNLNIASFATADTSSGAPLALWIRDGKQAAEYISLIEASVLGSVFRGLDGAWQMYVWDPTFTASALPALVDADIADWSVDSKIESVYAGAVVRYDQNPSTSAVKEAQSTDDSVRYLLEAPELARIDTVLKSGAEALAQRYRLLACAPRVLITMTERGLSLMASQIFDKALVTRARAPHATGSYVSQPMDIRGITKGFGPPRVTLGELPPWASRVGHWAATGIPVWGSASAAERLANGFWSDSNGRIDPGDAATTDLSVWG